MKYADNLSQPDFDALLLFLAADREEAGREYERVRSGLVRYFRYNGCAHPNRLADETMNRVAMKLSRNNFAAEGSAVTYFYGFAANILKEYRRDAAREVELDVEPAGTAAPVEESEEAASVCLERCLGKLPADERELVVEYYSRDRSEKIELRRRLCARLNLQASALYTRISRTKSVLRDCIEQCMKQYSP